MTKGGPGNKISSIPMVELVGDITNLRSLDYLALNGDVRAAKLDAFYHYQNYGQSEGRSQVVRSDQVVAMRRHKLSKIEMKSGEIAVSSVDGTINYLPDSIRKSFQIPEIPPVAENEYNQEIIKQITENPDSLFLDVGAGFRHTYYHNVVNTEIWSAASTDVVCVAEDLPFASNTFDNVFCLAVLEHTKRPWLAVEEIIRVLKPGGQVRIDWPFLQPVHGYPHHFFNATHMGVVSQFDDQCDIISAEVRPWQHPVFSLTWILKEWDNGLKGVEKERFGELSIRELLNRSPELLLREPWCQELFLETQSIISAGTTLIANKR